MKRLALALGIATLFSSSLFAGKDVAPAIEPPAPIPAKPSKPKIVPPIGLYLGAGLTYAYNKCQCAPLTTSDGIKIPTSKSHTYGYNLRGGYEYNQYIGLEARYIATPWGDDNKELKHFGIYLKPSYNLIDNLDIYGLLGYGKTKCDYQNINENGFAWGVGAEYLFGKREAGKKKGWGVYAEYTRPLKKNDANNITTNVGNIGVAYHY